MPCLPPAPSLGIPGALLKNQFPLTPCSLLPTSAVLGAKGTQAGGHFSGGRCNNNKMDKVGQTRILLPWFSLARLWVPQFQCGHKQRTALGCCGLGQAVKFRDVCEPHWPRKCTGITGKDTSMKKSLFFHVQSNICMDTIPLVLLAGLHRDAGMTPQRAASIVTVWYHSVGREKDRALHKGSFPTPQGRLNAVGIHGIRISSPSYPHLLFLWWISLRV